MSKLSYELYFVQAAAREPQHLVVKVGAVVDVCHYLFFISTDALVAKRPEADRGSLDQHLAFLSTLIVDDHIA